MSYAPYERPATSSRLSSNETIEFRLLVAILLIFSAFVLLGSRLVGRKAEMPFWKEVKSTAYAAAGYAFKY